MARRNQALPEMTPDQYDRHMDYIRARRAERRVVRHTDPCPADIRKRNALAKDPVKWLQYYAPGTFTLTFGANHLAFIAKLHTALRKGGLRAIGMPRGEGKTSIAKWMVIMAICEGWRKFVAVVAANGPMATNLHNFYRAQFETNNRLHQHYPHITTYFRAAEGKPLKAQHQLQASGASTELNWKDGWINLPAIMDATGRYYPGAGAAIVSLGITGAFRGLCKETGGVTIRPDFVLLDDIQTREVAMSPAQCATREKIVQGDVLGLAGPATRIAGVMTCTIIRKGDLAARFLDRKLHPEWSGDTFRMVTRWPRAQKTLWKDYGHIYRECLATGDGDISRANDFYETNRAAMDAGAAVSWPERIRDGELSALQTAQNLLIEHGEEEFCAEYQNAPREGRCSLYTLTPELIMSRAIDIAPGMWPDWVTSVIASSDVNPTYGISTAILGFNNEQRCHVGWYGVTPINAPVVLSDAERKRIIIAGLADVLKLLRSTNVPPARWYIDGGGSPQDTVIDFAAAARNYGISTMTCFGRGWRNYRQAPATASRRVRPGYNLYNVSESVNRYWTIWHADYWREVAQKGWTTTPSAPGACSLPKGTHREFSEQVAREQLIGRSTVSGRDVWIWETANGPHDYGDVMAQGYMGACELNGIGAAVAAPAITARGAPRIVPRKTQKKRRIASAAV